MKYLSGCMLAFLLSFAVIPVARAIPPIQQKQLHNGLRVLLMEADNVPMVVMRLTVPVGSRLDPKGKGGAASMLAEMLEDHTRQHDFVAWANLLDAQAIRLGASAGRDSLSISMTALKEALPEGVHALAESALMPGWSKKRFLLLKADDISSARKSLENPGVRAAQTTIRMLYPNHGYGHRPGGTVDSLDRLKLADLRSLYHRQFKPQGAVLAISGDITMKEALRQIRPLFSRWKGTPEESLKDVPSPKSARGQKRHVTMSTRQMTVQLSRLGPSRYAPHFFADMLLNYTLGGGGFSSQLMKEVREKRGLVYGVYSYFMPLATSGPFVITLQTRADQAGRALKVVRDVMRRMYHGHISQRELAAAKENLIGGFAHRVDENRKRVKLMSMIGFYGLPLGYLQNWARHIKAVTLAEVKAAAVRFLAPADWNTVEIGPES